MFSHLKICMKFLINIIQGGGVFLTTRPPRGALCLCKPPSFIHLFLCFFPRGGCLATGMRAEDRCRVDQDQGRQGLEGPHSYGLPLRDTAPAEPTFLLPAPSAQEAPQVRRQHVLFVFRSLLPSLTHAFPSQASCEWRLKLSKGWVLKCIAWPTRAHSAGSSGFCRGLSISPLGNVFCQRVASRLCAAGRSCCTLVCAAS